MAARGTILGLGALLACGTALAEDPRVDAKISRVEARLERLAPGHNARPDAKALRAELQAIKELYGRYEADGLSDRERRDLSRRLFELDKSMNAKDESVENPRAEAVERPS